MTTSHLRHFMCTFHVIPHAEHTQQQPGLDGPGQCVMKLVLSLAVFKEAVDGLPTSLSSCRSCPVTASMFRRRVILTSVWNFLPTTWRKKDATVQNGQIEQTGKQPFHPLPCPTADRVTISHSVTLIHIFHVTVTICHIWLYCVALFTEKISFLGWIMNVSQHADVTLVQLLYWMSPHLSLTVLHLRSSGMPFLISLTIPQQLIFLSLHQTVQTRQEIVHVQFLATSFYFPSQFYYCGRGCCQVLWHVLSVSFLPHVDFHVIRVTSRVTKFVHFDTKTFMFLGNILSENRPFLKQHDHFINCQTFWMVVKCGIHHA